MRLTYEYLKMKPKSLQSLTTLKKDEFEELSKAMEAQWEGYIRHNTLEGKPRNRTSYVRSNNTLAQPEDRLLFILYYLKAYPLQEVMAASFEMTQAQVSIWVSRLSKLLEGALEKHACLPVRKSEQLKAALAGEQSVIIDGTERAIVRPSDNDVQREYYSGKKRFILSRIT